MRISIIIILSFFSFLSFGQEEQPANKTITEQFIDAYNAGNYELIFNMYADPMKEALPLEIRHLLLLCLTVTPVPLHSDANV